MTGHRSTLLTSDSALGTSSPVHCHAPSSVAASHEAHDGHEPHETSTRRLLLALGLSLVFFVLQVITGFATGSLALLADSGHLLSDSVALGLALGAAWLAARPPSSRRTFGFRRAEVLAALANGLTLFGVAAVITFEAIERFQHPQTVNGGPMLIVAAAGLIANFISLRILGHGHSLNERGAYLHVLGDLLGSFGVIVAAVLMLLFGWYQADPILSIVISGLVLISAWRLVREAVDVLLLAVPQSIDLTAVRRSLLAEPGVTAVHDLHVWTVSSGFVSLSSHITVSAASEPCDILTRLTSMLADRFGIEHTTLQVEHEGAESGLHPACDPCATPGQCT